ncbi:nuclear mitotic apparatus protein 1 [Lampris incognitus]|uniref:nuclear mitotic apparatus protein 1 n=1 Tax=Lampris incognitus TaxID=2546036 RepID=UPI0024B50C30|nr:nuclear mitotic apparatus protein 1 [Lampris incognitus]
MAMNMGVKALLAWFNSMKLAERELSVHDLNDGIFLLQVVHKLKDETHGHLNLSIEARLQIIADFLERDCRFSPDRGASVSWDDIKNGDKLTVEISKVLLLLVYYDMMNDRCTLNMLEYEVEREIAVLTDRFVLECEGHVFLNGGIEAYLGKKYLSVTAKNVDGSDTSSITSPSTFSSLSDESPVFHRSPKVKFMELQTVASSSVSKSPLQYVMNTPQFQLKKLKRQMAQDSEYRDELAKELASKMALIAQRESHINQLQYHLDKLKGEQSEQEKVAGEQLQELQAKNDMLQSRVHELFKHNNDMKSNSSHMERKLDELMEENGILSVQVKEVCSQLVLSEAEVRRLMENEESAQKEWSLNTCHIQSKLDHAMAEKEFLNEQIQILQGKILSLEDQMTSATEEERGENMGPIMEREVFEKEINCLKNQLESTVASLRKTELEVQAKEIQLAEYQQEIIQQKERMEKQVLKAQEQMQAKEEFLAKLQRESSEQRCVLQQEIQDLKLQVDSISALLKKAQADSQTKDEQHQQEYNRQKEALQQAQATSEEQVRRLKEEIHSKQEQMDNLKKEHSEQSALLNVEIQVLKNQVESLHSSVMKAEEEVQTKEDILNKQQQESSKIQEALQERITMFQEEVHGLHDEVKSLLEKLESMSSSINDAEENIKAKEQQLAKLQQEKTEQRDILQGRLDASEVEMEKLKEAQKANENLLLQAEERIEHLQKELSNANSFCADKDLKLNILQDEVAVQTESVRKAKAEIETKEDMLAKLLQEGSHRQEVLQCEIQVLKDQVESQTCSLKKANDDIQAKEDQLAKNQQEDRKQKEALQEQIVVSQEEVKKLNAEIQSKEQQLILLKNEYSSHSELLQQEIKDLKNQVESIGDCLKKADEQVQSQSVLLITQEQENAHQRELLQQQLFASEEEVKKMTKLQQEKTEQRDILQGRLVASEVEMEKLKEAKKANENLLVQAEERMEHLQKELSNANSFCADKDLKLNILQDEVAVQTESVRKAKAEIETKEDMLAKLLQEGSHRQEVLQCEIQVLKDQVESQTCSLKKANDGIQAKEDQLTKNQQEDRKQKEALQEQIVVSQEEVKKLNAEIQSKEQQLILLKNEYSSHSELLQQEIKDLKNQVESIGDCLKKADEQVQFQSDLLIKQEQENAHLRELLQQQVFASEEEVKKMTKLQQEKTEQRDILQGRLVASEVEMEKLKEARKANENLLLQAEERIEHLQKELSNANSLCADKEIKLNILQDEVAVQTESVRKAKAEIETKEDMLAKLLQEGSHRQEVLQCEIQVLKDQVESQTCAIKKANDDVQAKEDQLTKNQQEDRKQKEALQEQIVVSQEEVKKLNAEIQSKEQQLILLKNECLSHSELLQQEIRDLKNQVESIGDCLKKADEQVQIQSDLLIKQEQENAHQREILQQQVFASEEEVKKMKGEIQARERQLHLLKKDSSDQSALVHQEIQGLNSQLESLRSSLRKAEEQLQAKEVIIQEKEALLARVLQAEQSHEALRKHLEVCALEKDKLDQAKQILERENKASHKLKLILQQELTSLKQEQKICMQERKKAEEQAKLTRDLQEQLTAKSEAAAHYKAQMEKAVSHYDGKKKLLQESLEKATELQHSLEMKEYELKAVTTEFTLLQLDLETTRGNENNLLRRVASLESQLAFADRNLREKNKIHGNEGSVKELAYLDTASVRKRVQTRAQMEKYNSSDSLEQSSLEDSLNTTRRPSAPGESSTPLVRSSERLAAKRRALGTESLETLYFTPMNSKQMKTTSMECNLEHTLTSPGDFVLDSARKNLTSSVKRRRTTQVVNITMTKKTPGRGGNECDETFYSLSTAHSQPNLSHPISMEPFDTPARLAGTASDQLLSLPGYRRSAAHNTAHPRGTSTFCVGAEHEPDSAGDDWMRIAELQARNKSCLPHLKSSYPVESRPGLCPAFICTDEDLRTGDPSETIRRASMIPGQLQDSLFSNRLSFMVGQTGTHSLRHSLMPGQLPSKIKSSAKLQSPRGTKRPSSTLLQPQSSPETKVKAGCFPLTPKNKISNGPSSSALSPTTLSLSQAERRQSMMFTVENTPKKNTYLQKGLNKLLNSNRKSPGKKSKKSPAQTISHKAPRTVVSRSGMGRTRNGSVKSPQTTARGQRKSPRAVNTAKSPGITASARKLMRFKMKV